MSSLILDCDEQLENNSIQSLIEKHSIDTLYTYNPYFYDVHFAHIKIKEIPSSKDYLQFRKDFYYELEECFTKENPKLSRFFVICKYPLLFENEIIYHKIWLINKVKKDSSKSIIYYSDKQDLTINEREEIFKNENVTPLFLSKAKPSFRSSSINYFREHIQRLSGFMKNKQTIKEAEDREIFFIENIDNNIKVGQWFKKNNNCFRSKTAILNTNHNNLNNSDINYYSISILYYIYAILKSELHYQIIKKSLKFKTFSSNSTFKQHMLLNIRPMIFDVTYFNIFFKKIARRTNIKYAISTNFASIYSRVSISIFKKAGIKTLYLQHGLLESEEYLMDIQQDYINLWGKAYTPFLSNKYNNILYGNILDYIKNRKKANIYEKKTNKGKINILFLPSRTGGNIVTVSDNKYMFEVICQAINNINSKLKCEKFSLTIKLHPNDEIGESIFKTNVINPLVTKEHDSKYWINEADICIASNSTAGTEICYYLKPFIYFTTSKTMSIISTYKKYNLGFGVENTEEMTFAIENIEKEHESRFLQAMLKFNNDFAQEFEIDEFEKFVTE